MCSSAGDMEDFTVCGSSAVGSNIKELLQRCRKCQEKSVLVLQKKDPYCKSCFFEYCNHKFRSTIGKSKKIKHGDKVLLACSGGRKSSALLHMTVQTLKSASMKQISFTPAVLFIDDLFLENANSEDLKTNSFCIVKELQSANYPVFYSSLDMVNRISSSEDLYISVPENLTCDVLNANDESRAIMKESFQSLHLSLKIDLLKHLRLLLLAEIARRAGFKHVFLGETASSLAVELLSDIALGRGSQISADTSFCDTRHKVTFCRPLREFLDKEIALYNHLHSIKYHVFTDFLTKASSNSCIQRLTETFLTSLQESFPATIFTVFRTGGKLCRNNFGHGSKTCIVCQSELDNCNPDPCSALEALKISHQLSSSNQMEKENYRDIMEFLCHGCSITFTKIACDKNFDYLFPTSYLTKKSQDDLREEIKEFLIDDI